MILLAALWDSLVSTTRDILPIVIIIGFFQIVVLRRPLVNLPRLMWGFAFVLFGLAMFLMGLKLALFPLGEEMANQLTASVPVVVQGGDGQPETMVAAPWYAYYWTYLFAFAIGFSTTIAEPALIAVAFKAEEVSGGALRSRGLRIAVAIGAGTGVALGTLRIVMGIPLPYFILSGYAIVVLQTFFSPKSIIPVAYDSGGVTTSTVTVPIVAALGLGLASRIPGRDPIVDGFGLIAFTALFPVISVMGYSQLAAWFNARRMRLSQVDSPPTSVLPPLPKII